MKIFKWIIFANKYEFIKKIKITHTKNSIDLFYIYVHNFTLDTLPLIFLIKNFMERYLWKS